jgi:hypothetical protein
VDRSLVSVCVRLAHGTGQLPTDALFDELHGVKLDVESKPELDVKPTLDVELYIDMDVKPNIKTEPKLEPDGEYEFYGFLISALTLTHHLWLWSLRFEHILTVFSSAAAGPTADDFRVLYGEGRRDAIDVKAEKGRHASALDLVAIFYAANYWLQLYRRSFRARARISVRESRDGRHAPLLEHGEYGPQHRFISWEETFRG